MPRVWRRRLLRSLALVLCLAASCSLFADGKRIGVSRTEGGGLRIHYVPCPGEVVTRVAMLSQVGSGIATVTGDDEPGDDPDDDEIVEWHIASPGSELEVFEVGATPDGFAEVVPLSTPVSSFGGVAVFVGARRDGLRSVEIGFDLDDVTPTAILTLDGSKDSETFRREGAAACE
jgi:hypothetical protein